MSSTEAGMALMASSSCSSVGSSSRSLPSSSSLSETTADAAGTDSTSFAPPGADRVSCRSSVDSAAAGGLLSAGARLMHP